MRVGAAKTKVVDASVADAFALLQHRGFSVQGKIEIFEWNIRIGIVDM